MMVCRSILQLFKTFDIEIESDRRVALQAKQASDVSLPFL